MPGGGGVSNVERGLGTSTDFPLKERAHRSASVCGVSGVLPVGHIEADPSKRRTGPDATSGAGEICHPSTVGRERAHDRRQRAPDGASNRTGSGPCAPAGAAWEHIAPTASTENQPASPKVDVVATFSFRRAFTKDLQLFKGSVAEVGLAGRWAVGPEHSVCT